jgi:hypothetical protein
VRLPAAAAAGGGGLHNRLSYAQEGGVSISLQAAVDVLKQCCSSAPAAASTLPYDSELISLRIGPEAVRQYQCNQYQCTGPRLWLASVIGLHVLACQGGLGL